MSIAIIEDDPMSSDLLISTFDEINEEVEIKAVLRNVKDAIVFFNTRPELDLLISDVQLQDGLTFTIFESAPINCPIIFISAYDQYMVNAFDYAGIDYLLKPVSTQMLEHSINKYKALQSHFLATNTAIKNFLQHFEKKRTRIIVKKGYSFISLPLTEVVIFYTENLVVYVIDAGGNKYLIDKNLNTLEEELDPQIFFRANRQYIVNIDFIQGYKSYERVKLIVTLKKETDHLIVVGQEKAKAFRKWIAEA